MDIKKVLSNNSSFIYSLTHSLSLTFLFTAIRDLSVDEDHDDDVTHASNNNDDNCTQSWPDEPNCIVTDRELAMVNAIVNAFPSSYVFLCTLHIKRDASGWLVREVKSFLLDAGVPLTKKRKDPVIEAIVRFIYNDFQRLMYDTETNIDMYKSKKELFRQRFLQLSSHYFRELNDDNHKDFKLPEFFLRLTMTYSSILVVNL